MRRFSVVFLLLALNLAVSALAAPPVTVSPGAGDEVLQVEGRCPTFSWGLVPQAASYRLVVYRVDEQAAEQVSVVLSVGLPGSASSWTPPLQRCLGAGATYAWRVGAVAGEGEPAWSEPAWFEVPGATPSVPVDVTTTPTIVDLPGDGKDGTVGSGSVAAEGKAPAGGAVALRPAVAAALATYFSVGSTGNVTGNIFTGDGSGLTNLQKGNIAGLTAGGVTFGGAGLAQDAANFFWDDGNNRLGLGTASPNEQLELTGNLRLSTYGAQIQFGASRFVHAMGSMNTWVGEGAGRVSSTGYQNVGVGYQALSTEATGGFGYHNTAVGSYALAGTSSGSANTAVGFWALKSNTTADNNVAFGESALQNNTTGTSNSGLGSYTLMNSTTASRNTAVGFSALSTQSYSNDNTSYETDNTAVGADALYSNQPANGSGTSGAVNTAVGSKSMYRNTTGWSNTAIGYGSLWNNQTGLSNTAVGTNALNSASTSASYNVAVGLNAGYNATGSSCVFLGQGAGFSEGASNRLHIANSSGSTLIYGEFDNSLVVIADKTPGVSSGLDVNGYIRARSWAAGATTYVCRTAQGVLGDCGQQPFAASATVPVPSEGTGVPGSRARIGGRVEVAEQQAVIADLEERLAEQEALIAALTERLAALEAAGPGR